MASMSIVSPPREDNLQSLDLRTEQFGRISMAMIIILVIGVSIWIPIGLTTFYDPISERIVFLSALIIYTSSAIAYICLRIRRVQTSVLVLATGIIGAISSVLFITGLIQSGAVLLVYSLPMIVVGLTWGRRGLSFFGLIIILIVALLTYAHERQIGVWRDSLDSPIAILMTFALALFLIVSILDQFQHNLRMMLKRTLQQEVRLDHLRNSLEQIVEERTSTLRSALERMQARELALKETVEELERTQKSVEALSAPILPILPRVLVLPIIGNLSPERAQLVSKNVLRATYERRARAVILDITGLPVLDTELAQKLIATSKAAQLLGTRVALVGIQPEVAQTLTALQIDFRDLQIYADLESAIENMLAKSRKSKQIILSQH
jgi:rsbT co-antagonist protein RsbR